MAELMPHIKLSEETGAKYALLPGDPGRIDRIKPYLEEVRELACNREFRSVLGRYKGVSVLAVSTGIGGASTAIAVEELARIGVKAMVRIGSSGALQRELCLGDLVIATGAVRDDGASAAYIERIYPAVPDFLLTQLCIQGASGLGARCRAGIIRSHDSFYTDREEEIDAYWSLRGVLGADMETAALFVAGGLRGVRTASILNTVVEYGDALEENINSYTDGEKAVMTGEKNEILAALEAFAALAGERETQ